jgi:uncharacterized protein YbaP (TraB family)
MSPHSSFLPTLARLRAGLRGLVSIIMIAVAGLAGAQEPAYDPTRPQVLPAQPAGTAAAADPERHKAFIWEVRSAQNTVYLFGTIHVGKRSFYPLPEQVEGALKKSARLVVEADISRNENEDQVRALIAYPPPQSLQSQLPAPLYERLQRQLQKLKMPPDGLRQLKPYIAGGFISIAEFTRLGYDRNFGVDGYLIASAQRDNKPILELESQLGQLRMFDGMPSGLQEAFLDNALSVIEGGRTPDQVTGMVNAWQSGDAELMQEVTAGVNQDMRLSAEIEDVLIYNRHPAMLKKIEAFLADEQPYFVAIGSLHLIGKRGLVELLRAKGYQVRQL